MNPERRIPTMTDNEFTSPASQLISRTETADRTGPDMLTLTLAQEIKDPSSILFQKGKIDRGIQHFRLTDEGRQTTQNAFKTFTENTSGSSIEEKAQSINQIDFSHLGFNDQQNETFRRSLRAQLLVSEARKLHPENRPWDTVRDARREAPTKNQKEISAFQALDQALAKANQVQQDQIEETLGEKAQATQSAWEKFIGFKWLTADTRKARKNRLGVAASLGSVALGAMLYLNNPQPASSLEVPTVPESSLTITPPSLPAETTPPPAPATPTPKPVTSTLKPETITPEKKEEEAASPTPERTTPPTFSAKEDEEDILESKRPLRSTPQSPETKEPPPNWLEIQPGDTITITSADNEFEPFNIQIISAGEFLEKQNTRKTVADYSNAAISGQQALGAGETILQVDSGTWNNQKLPAQILLDNLNPGEKITFTNQKGETKTLRLIGITQPFAHHPSLPGEDPFDAARQAADQEFPQVVEARENGKTHLLIVTCAGQWTGSEYLERRGILLEVE